MTRGLRRDVRSGWRALRREPAAGVLAMVSVALGIGANTAIFSLVNALLLRPLSGVRAPRELVRLETALPSTILADLNREPEFAGACGVSTPLLTVEVAGEVKPVGVLAMTGECPQVLGIQAQAGRMLTAADDREGGARAAVLTDTLWRQAFAGRSDALGAGLRVDGVPFTVAGVAHPDFHGVLLGFWPGILLPASQDPSGAHSTAGARHFSWVYIFARLAPGATIRQAQARLNAAAERLLQDSVSPQYQGVRRQRFMTQPLRLVPAANGLDYMLRNRFSRPLGVALGICLMVLLVSCVNLANLLLARGVRRRREIGLRLAIGASRARVVRQLAMESFLLVGLGAAAGLAVARLTDAVILRQVHTALINFSLTAPLDGRVLAFAALAALATGMGFGILPAWRSSDVNVMELLKGSNRHVHGSGAAGRMLIAAQLALALALVAGTGLFVSSLVRLRNAPVGFRADGVAALQLFPLPNGYAHLAAESYYRELLSRVESLPGVAAASYSNFAPLDAGFARRVSFTTDPERGGVPSHADWASDGFLRTMGIPLLAGRDFRRSDCARQVRTAIVSSSLARRLSADANVLGRHIRFGDEPEDQDLEIIGVAADARLTGLHAPAPAMVYINLWQYSYSAKYGVLLVRARNLDPPLIDALRRTVRGAGREYVQSARTMRDKVEQALLAERLLAWLSSAFGMLALVLAAAGLYGLMSYHVAGRTGEIGIRMALGATRPKVGWMIVREALRLSAAGLLGGLVLTLAAGRFIRTLLYGIGPFDAPLFCGAAAILLATALLAAWIPARRACRVDPLEALRHE